VLNTLMGIVPGLFSLGGKFIQDADKRAEYAFRVQEMVQKFMEVMLQTKTYPFIDGLVKLAYAGEAIVKGLFRPVVTTCMFAFAIYAEINLIELSEGIQAILYGAFPAWGVSRHQLRIKEQQKKETNWEDDF